MAESLISASGHVTRIIFTPEKAVKEETPNSTIKYRTEGIRTHSNGTASPVVYNPDDIATSDIQRALANLKLLLLRVAS